MQYSILTPHLSTSISILHKGDSLPAIGHEQLIAMDCPDPVCTLIGTLLLATEPKVFAKRGGLGDVASKLRTRNLTARCMRRRRRREPLFSQGGLEATLRLATSGCMTSPMYSTARCCRSASMKRAYLLSTSITCTPIAP